MYLHVLCLLLYRPRYRCTCTWHGNWGARNELDSRHICQHLRLVLVLSINSACQRQACSSFDKLETQFKMLCLLYTCTVLGWFSKLCQIWSFFSWHLSVFKVHTHICFTFSAFLLFEDKNVMSFCHCVLEVCKTFIIGYNVWHQMICFLRTCVLLAQRSSWDKYMTFAAIPEHDL